jgi:hypothetical protein
MNTHNYAVLDKLINTLDFKGLKLNDMYNGSYVYTLSRCREMIRQKVSELLPEIKHDQIDLYLLNLINSDYTPHIKRKIDEIAAIPIIEQKSPEWFKQRETMISASDAGYFLKKCGASRALDSLKIKIGLKNYVNSSAPPLMHGNTYEDVTRAIYESRNCVTVTEYGILSSPTSCIGASPDGIVTACNAQTFECQSKYGRLLEIKNPYSREIDVNVKPEYMVQILQQQYTCVLPICDFVETTIVDANCNTNNSNYKPYITLNDMLIDRLDTSNTVALQRVKNKNIPIKNLNKFGNEKGLVVWFQKKIAEGDIRNKYILYPLNMPYEEMAIQKWIVDTKSEQFNLGFEYVTVKYWRLDVYSEKTVVYDQKIFEGDYVPKLKDVWNVIVKCKMLKAKGENVALYIEDLENRKDTPFYNDNKRKKKISSTASSSSVMSSISFENNPDIELDF